MLRLIDHMHVHLAKIVYHCCITKFPHRTARTKTRKKKKKEATLFMQLVSMPMFDLKVLGLMGELKGIFGIAIEHDEVNNCVGYCFTFKNIFQLMCFAMLHCTSD